MTKASLCQSDSEESSWHKQLKAKPHDSANQPARKKEVATCEATTGAPSPARIHEATSSRGCGTLVDSVHTDNSNPTRAISKKGSICKASSKPNTQALEPASGSVMACR